MFEVCPVCRFGRAPLKKAFSQAKLGGFWIGQIRSATQIFRMRTGKVLPVNFYWLEKQSDETKRQIVDITSQEYAGFHDHSTVEGLERTLREYAAFQDAVKKNIESFKTKLDDLLKRIYFGAQRFSDEVNPHKAAAFSEKRFTEAKTYPAKPEEREKEKMKNTMKIYRDGHWQYAETKGEDVAQRAKAIQRENPNLDFAECLVRAEKETLEKEDRGDGEKHFAESSLQEFAERFPGVPEEAIQKLKDAKRGVTVRLSDGTSWIKVRSQGQDRILPCSTEGAEAALAFQDEKNFRGGRFVGPQERKAPGYSSDRKTFTDRSGTTLDVRNDAEVAEAVEIEVFAMQFSRELMSVPMSGRREVVTKTLRILRNAGIEQPMKPDPEVVHYAVQAAQGGPEILDRALRYTAEGAVQAFGSVTKALIAAVA